MKTKSKIRFLAETKVPKPITVQFYKHSRSFSFTATKKAPKKVNVCFYEEN